MPELELRTGPRTNMAFPAEKAVLIGRSVHS
jgi:hypothetical protein